MQDQPWWKRKGVLAVIGGVLAISVIGGATGAFDEEEPDEVAAEEPEPDDAEDVDEPAEEPDDEPEPAEEPDEVDTISGGTASPEAITEEQTVCDEFVYALNATLDGEDDEIVREEMGFMLEAAEMLPDEPGNRPLYTMAEGLVEAWDADDMDGVEQESQRLAVRCDIEYEG